MEAAARNAELPDGCKVATGRASYVNERIKRALNVPKVATLRKKVLALVPPDLRRSRIGKFTFIAVALGACIFCAYHLVELSIKFLSFEPQTATSVLSEDQPVNFSLHYYEDSFERNPYDFADSYVTYLLEKRNISIVYRGQTITNKNDLNLSLIARYFNYYRSDELCVPSPNSSVTQHFYSDNNFDYRLRQIYLTEVKTNLDIERQDAASIKIGGFSLDTFPWVFYYEDWFENVTIHTYSNTDPVPGCEQKKVPSTVKAEGHNYVRITYTLPKLSCIPCMLSTNGLFSEKGSALYLSAGTASTKPLSRDQVRPSMADSVRFLKAGTVYVFSAQAEVVKRQSRYCNKDINPENDCESACLRKEISKQEEDKHRKTYYEAFEPRAFWRNRTVKILPGDIYTQYLCSSGNQEKLSKIGIGKKFDEQKRKAEEKCRKHCHDCTACRMPCSETRVTLHYPDAPQHISSPDVVVQVRASYEEIMLTEYKVGYTFQLFASDVGGMVKLSATIIGCVSLAAIFYKCVVMRRRLKAEAKAGVATGEKKQRVRSAKKKITKGVMDLFD